MKNLLNVVTGASTTRWYPLRPHPIQDALVSDKIRFKVVPAGRRSGKTERAKRFVVRECFSTPASYFVAAPTRDQVKRIYWNDLKAMSFQGQIPLQISESDLIIAYPNGSTLSLIGLDQPQRMEGVIWGGGIIDEIADTKPEAWPENISPALDTVDPRRPEYRAWAWLIGVPDGLNHYYDLADYAGRNNDSDWKLYHWKSSEILPKDVIDAAKRRMSSRQFRQEYEASFETASGRIYDDYGVANLAVGMKIQPHEQIVWGHDFNYTPMSSFIGVFRDESIYILDEIVLDSATARQSAEEFVQKMANHQNKNVLIFGDPAGRAGEKHGHVSDYIEIEGVLKSAGWKFERQVKLSAPSIRDRQWSVRAKIQTADGVVSLFVNPESAPTAHRGLSTVQVKPGSTFLEEVSREQHITTAIGYCVDFKWPVRVKVDTPIVFPTPSAHHWSFGRVT